MSRTARPPPTTSATSHSCQPYRDDCRRRYAVETTTNVNECSWGAESHVRFLVQDLIGTQRDRGGKLVLHLPWKAATWQDAEIPQLSNDSSVHRVQVLRGHGWLTNDDEIASALARRGWPLELCNVKIGRLSPKPAEAFACGSPLVPSAMSTLSQ